MKQIDLFTFSSFEIIYIYIDACNIFSIFLESIFQSDAIKKLYIQSQRNQE